MKGLDVSSDGCVTTSEESDDNNNDKRPIVRDLIREHRSLLDDMATALSLSPPDYNYDARKHDDLWCLRFLLSHKQDFPQALRAAQTTLIFRRDHGLDGWGDIRADPPQRATTAAWQRFRDGGGVTENSIVYTVPDPQRCGVLTFIDIGSMDPHQLAQLSVEDWIAGLAYMNEWNYQWVDYLTRTTGRLTKSVRLVDLGTFRLNQIDLTCQKRYTQAIGTMQDCFPQAVQCIYVCHAPAWVYAPWKAIRPLLPSRVVDKMDFLNPHDERDRERLLEVVALAPEHLPVRFGGSNEALLKSTVTTITSNENSSTFEEGGDDENNQEFIDAVQVPSLEETVSESTG